MFEYSHNVCKDCGQVFERISGKFREECTECGGKTEKLEVIASWGICNTASLNVFKIEYGINDRMLVAINDNRPEWYDITDVTELESNETQLGISYHGAIYPLDECMIVRS